MKMILPLLLAVVLSTPAFSQEAGRLLEDIIRNLECNKNTSTRSCGEAEAPIYSSTDVHTYSGKPEKDPLLEKIKQVHAVVVGYEKRIMALETHTGINRRPNPVFRFQPNDRKYDKYQPRETPSRTYRPTKTSSPSYTPCRNESRFDHCGEGK